MPRAILAATDLTESSDTVLRAAAALAAVADAELHVLHGLELPTMPYSESGREVATFEDRVQAARGALDTQLARVLPAQVRPTSVELVIRTVHRAVLERAEEVGADLIVLGAHRPRPFADRFLGSTADRVVRTATAPCLLVREPLSLPLRRVMVPTDLSEESVPAIDVAIGWARALGPAAAEGASGAEVQVVHVVPRAYQLADFAFDQEVIAPEMERIIDAALERAGSDRLPPLRRQVSWGDVPDDEILEEAQRQHVDLLVIGTHGHGAVRRALLGSVAARLARAAPCPVLLVPPGAERFEA